MYATDTEAVVCACFVVAQGEERKWWFIGSWDPMTNDITRGTTVDPNNYCSYHNN